MRNYEICATGRKEEVKRNKGKVFVMLGKGDDINKTERSMLIMIDDDIVVHSSKCGDVDVVSMRIKTDVFRPLNWPLM